MSLNRLPSARGVPPPLPSEGLVPKLSSEKSPDVSDRLRVEPFSLGDLLVGDFVGDVPIELNSFGGVP